MAADPRPARLSARPVPGAVAGSPRLDPMAAGNDAAPRDAGGSDEDVLRLLRTGTAAEHEDVENTLGLLEFVVEEGTTLRHHISQPIRAVDGIVAVPDAPGLRAATRERIEAWNELGRRLCSAFLAVSARAPA